MTEQKTNGKYKSVISYQSETLTAEPIRVNNKYALELGSTSEGQSITIFMDEIPALIKVAKGVMKLAQPTPSPVLSENEVKTEQQSKAKTESTAKKSETPKTTTT